MNKTSHIVSKAINFLGNDGLSAAFNYLYTTANAADYSKVAEVEPEISLMRDNFNEYLANQIDVMDAGADPSQAEIGTFSHSDWMMKVYELAVHLECSLSEKPQKTADSDDEYLAEWDKDCPFAEKLSGILSEEAMLQFQPNLSSEELDKAEWDIQTNLDALRRYVFDEILNIKIWEYNKLQRLQNLLLSPLVDENSLILFMSALNLCSMKYFSKDIFHIQKKLYLESPLLSVRMYALVGMLMTSKNMGELALLGAMDNEFDQLVKVHPAFVKDVYRVQKWIGVIAISEDRSREFTKKMLSGVLKQSMKDMGEETEEERVKRITSSDDEDELPEDVKDLMESIIDDEQKGYDLYVDQFRSFAKKVFFRKISSWFMPFDVQNPVVLKKTRAHPDTAINIQIMQRHSDLCDSDLYGFFTSNFAYNKNILQDMRDSLPPEAVEDIANGVYDKSKDKPSKKTIIRNYFRLLIRFFVYYPDCQSFENPFTGSNEDATSASCIITNGCFDSHPFDGLFDEVKTFAHENRLPDLLTAILQHNGNEPDDVEGCIMMAEALLDKGSDFDAYSASTYAKTVLEMEPDNIRALYLLMESGIATENDDDIIASGSRILKEDSHLDNPEPLRIMKINIARAYVRKGMIEDALKLIYEMHYNDPEDADVMALLAYCLLHRKEGDKAQLIAQAEKLADAVISNDMATVMKDTFQSMGKHAPMEQMIKAFGQVLEKASANEPITDIISNYCKALCQFSRHQVKDAMSHFKHAFYYSRQDKKLKEFFDKLFREDMEPWLKDYGYDSDMLSVFWDMVYKSCLENPFMGKRM